MKYFSRITTDYFNELQPMHIEARNELAQLDRLVIDEAELDDFRRRMLQIVDILNQNYPRAHLIFVKSKTFQNDAAYIIPNFFKIVLYKIRENG